MKFKVILTAAVVSLAAWSLALAGDGPQYGTPRGGPQALASADYGGVLYATAAFGPVSGGGVHYTTACNTSGPGNTKQFCRGVFYGVVFTTAGVYPIPDFVDVYDSTSSNQAPANFVTRVYNQYNLVGSTIACGFSGVDKPIRFNNGLIIRPSVSTENLITVLYYKEP